jgi:hypothetical protein
MRRQVLFLVAAIVGLALATAPAFAGGKGAQTETIHFTDTDTFVVLPGEEACGVGAGSVITTEFKGVLHITEGPKGQFHITGTNVGDITVAVAGGQTYTGHFADWFGFNANSRNEAGTFTSNNILTAPDGSRLNVHFLGHVSVSASGEVNEFFQLNCGGGNVTRP